MNLKAQEKLNSGYHIQKSAQYNYLILKNNFSYKLAKNYVIMINKVYCAKRVYLTTTRNIFGILEKQTSYNDFISTELILWHQPKTRFCPFLMIEFILRIEIF